MNKIKKLFSIFLIGVFFPAVSISQTIQWKSGNSTSGDEDSGTITWTMTAASYSGSCDPCNVQVSVKNSSTSTSSSDYSYFGTKTITITADGDYTVQFTLLDDNIDEDSETFILGGVTLHESKRTILTNTTTTGTLDVEDNYYSVKALTGTKFKSKKLIPDFGFTASGSITPNHSESKYYSWNTKSILNLSTYIEDEYNFNIKNEKNNLNLGWNIDLRKLVVGDEQDYKINGTKATYTQDNDLTEEVVFSANVEFLKKISNSEKLSFGLDGFLSTQEAGGFKANINYIMKL